MDSTKNVNIIPANMVDDADKNNLPDHDTRYRRGERSRRGVDWRALTVGACVFMLLVACVGSWSWMELDRMRYEMPWAIDAIRLAIVGVIVGVPAALAYLAFGAGRVLVARSSIIRLANDHPVTVQQIASGALPEFAQETVRLSAMVETHWADHSLLRSNNQLNVPGQTLERLLAEPVPAQPAPLLPGPTPSASLLQQYRDTGLICRSGHSLLVGHDAAQAPHYVEMENCGFIAVGGQPRVGKTTAVRFLMAQAALQGWQLIVCDPHGAQQQGLIRQTESLKNAIIQSAIAPEDIIDAIRYVDAIGREREREPDADHPRLMLVIDEFTALVLDKELPETTLDLLVKMAVKYPKLHIHGLIIGHEWTGKLLGATLGASLRRSMTHRIVMRSDPQNAEFLLPSSALARQTANLQKGQALFHGDHGTTMVSIPWVGDVDLDWAGMHAPVARPMALQAPVLAPVARTERERWMERAAELRPRLEPKSREARKEAARILLAKGWPQWAIATACMLADETVGEIAKSRLNGYTNGVNGKAH